MLHSFPVVEPSDRVAADFNMRYRYLDSRAVLGGLSGVPLIPD
jgi:hypothetical protein